MTDPIGMPLRLLTCVPQAEIDPANRLLAAYLQRDPIITSFFARGMDELTAVARTVRARADRAQLSAALTDFQQRIDAHPHAVEHARLLADPTTPVVTVGQQPGLLLGPLYTVFKAMTAITVANRLAAELGRPVVPVFWVATDDDDRAEIDHCACWDTQLALHHITYPVEAGTPGQLVGDLPVECYASQVIADVMPHLAGLPFADGVRDMLEDTASRSVDFGEWFCRLLARLCSAQGLVLCDPRLSALRRLATPVLQREFAAPLATTQAVNARARELHRAGYRPQLTKPDDVCNAFLLIHGQRERITYQAGKFVAAGSEYTPDALQALVADHPERFCPNAVLRPVVQEYFFGSAAFIAGPNELGYWAELQPVFAALDVVMPPVVPRAGATFVPRQTARFLQQHTITPLDLLHDAGAVKFGLLAGQAPAAVQLTFTTGRTTIEQTVASLVDAVSSVDRTLAQSALATHQRMLNELERLERKTLKAIERQSQEVMTRYETAINVLFPHHGPQERLLCILAILARHGFDVLNPLLTLLDGKEGSHIFVEL